MGPSPGPLLQGGAASILSYTLVGGGHIPLGKGSMRPDERLRHTPVTGGLVGEHSRIKDPEPVFWVTERSGSSGFWHMSDLPTSWAESGLKPNPLCSNARVL